MLSSAIAVHTRRLMLTCMQASPLDCSLDSAAAAKNGGGGGRGAYYGGGDGVGGGGASVLGGSVLGAGYRSSLVRSGCMHSIHAVASTDR